MFTVIFEVRPTPGRRDEYLEHAKGLKPILEAIDGFVDNERFESCRREGWVLSLSTWRDEKAVVRWRTQSNHHGIQEAGRDGIFADYHLRVCEVTADSHPPHGLRVLEQRLDATEIGEAKALGITEISPRATGVRADPASLPSDIGFAPGEPGVVDYDVFESIANRGKRLLLTSWRTAGDAERFIPTSSPATGTLRHRCVRNVRDYGMYDRREAAQYYPDVTRPAAT